MKRKLIAALMAMTLTLSCGVTALAEEPSEGETEISQVGNGEDEDEGKVEKEGIVPNDSVNPSNDTVVTKDSLKEIEEDVTQKPNPAADGEDTAEQELPIDEEHFPDANFREYIKDKIDLDGNGSLGQEEIVAVTGIIISGIYGEESTAWCETKSLEGIEYFSDMTFLSCANLPLTSLDISKNAKLEGLTIFNCPVTNLVFNSNLKCLTCERTQLTHLDVSNLELNNLWCADNQLNTLVLSPTLKFMECSGNRLAYLDLSKEKELLVKEEGSNGGYTGHHGPTAGAYVTPQTLSRTVTSVNGVWTLDMASIVGKSYLDRVTLVTEGAKMSKDGLVTFQGSEVPKQLVYHFDTKNPAETTLMEVTVNLSGVNDQTKEEVAVDTSGMDIDTICKDNNVSPDNAEVVVSQETPSKENSDKLAGEATSKGLKVTATYEILLKLFSQGNEIAQITENFGNVTLTLQAGKDYAGHKAVIFQLHNGQVIEHDGLTVKADGTVTITVDKFSTFAVAVSEEKDSNIEKPGQTPDTANPPTANPKPVSTDNKNKTTGAGSVKTGDETSVFMWLLCGISTLGMIAFLQRKKRLS